MYNEIEDKISDAIMKLSELYPEPYYHIRLIRNSPHIDFELRIERRVQCSVSFHLIELKYQKHRNLLFERAKCMIEEMDRSIIEHTVTK